MRLFVLLLLLFSIGWARLTPAEIEGAQKRCKIQCEKSATASHFTPSCMKDCWSAFFHKVPQVHPSNTEIIKAPKKKTMVEIPYRNIKALQFREHLKALRAKKNQLEASAHTIVTRNATSAARMVANLFVLFLAVALFV